MSLQATQGAQPAPKYSYKLPTLSPSKVGDLVCPKLFAAKYITKTTPAEPWSHALTYGSGLHKLMYELYKPWNRVPVQARDISALAKAAFASQNYPRNEAHRRDQDVERAITTATLYVAGDPDAANTRQAETDERIEIGASKGEPITLFARFDRLVVRPDEPDVLRVIDYKTGNSSAEINLESAMLTLAVAKMAFKDRYPGRKPLLCYDFLNEQSGLAHREEVTADRVRHLWTPVNESAFAVYYSGNWDAVPGPQCQFCPLRLECRPLIQADAATIDALFDD